MPEILIISGPPAAGKSTVARAFADRYDRVAHVEVDAVRNFVTPTGYVGPDRPGFERQRHLAVRNVAAMARNFLDERFAVIVDDVVVTSEHLEDYLEALRPLGVPIHFIRLLPSLDVCLARNEKRPAGLKMRQERIETVHAQYIAAGDIGGVTLDSSALTANETADKLQALTTSGQSIVWRPGG